MTNTLKYVIIKTLKERLIIMENRIYCAVSYNDNGEQIIHAISFDRNSIKEYINGYKSETLLSLGIIFTDKKDVYICSE